MTETAQVPEVTCPDKRAELLALSEERDRQLAWRLEAWREGYRSGYRAGQEAGYRRGRDEENTAWLASLRPARDAALRTSRGPDAAELDRLRWGPGGRERFGERLPGDYLGAETIL